jgi:NAD(P)-dependent dehydrogenase (short-subunit alcohol dehydrogenase family)
VGRNRATLEAVARELSPQAGAVRCYVADLTSHEDLATLTPQILADFGRVDFLIHCAALLMRARLDVASVEDFDLQYACNVRAPFWITQKFLPRCWSIKARSFSSTRRPASVPSQTWANTRPPSMR